MGAGAHRLDASASCPSIGADWRVPLTRALVQLQRRWQEAGFRALAGLAPALLFHPLTRSATIEAIDMRRPPVDHHSAQGDNRAREF